MNLAKTDHAVSPVIATILLVAIAVALAAIILAVTMGFSGDTNDKQVGLNAKAASGPNATLLLYGGASLPELVELQMIDQDSPYGEYVEVWNKSSGAPNVGIPYPAADVAQPAEDMAVYDTKINVKGTFSDGKELILLVQPMTFRDVNASGKVPSKPTVFPPKVSDVGPSNGFVQADYKGMTSTPTNVEIYYQSTDKTEPLVQTIKDKVREGNTSGSVSGYMSYLGFPDEWSGGEYIVWANVTTPTDGTITSGKTLFRTPTTIISPPYLTTLDGKYIIRADFKDMSTYAYDNAAIGYTAILGGVPTPMTTTYTCIKVNETNSRGTYYTEGYIYYEIEKHSQYIRWGQTVDFWLNVDELTKTKGPVASIQLPPKPVSG